MERLNRELVLRTAVDFADEHGLETLSMRKLADVLGAGAMSLYHYVPSREALIDGMIEIVWTEITPPPPDAGWKAAMRHRAHSTRAALNRHRWAVGLMEGRKTTGPAGVQMREITLGALRRAGFSVELTIQAQSVQDAYIYGFALQEKNLPFETAEESTEVAAVTAEQIEALERDFPYLAEIVAGHVAKVGYDFSSAFEYGLELILDGLETRLAAARIAPSA